MYTIGYLHKVREHDVGLKLEEAQFKVVLGQLTKLPDLAVFMYV